MYTYAVFLRGINVGGNVMLPMARLKTLCEGAGCTEVRTYIQSGNVILKSPLGEEALMKKLEAVIEKDRKRHISVVVRTEKELEAIMKNDPFPKALPAQVGIMLFAKPVPKDFLRGVSTLGKEEVVVKKREVYIHYLEGMGRSKLKLPKVAAEGTVRNRNTIAKMAALAKG